MLLSWVQNAGNAVQYDKCTKAHMRKGSFAFPLFRITTHEVERKETLGNVYAMNPDISVSLTMCPMEIDPQPQAAKKVSIMIISVR